MRIYLVNSSLAAPPFYLLDFLNTSSVSIGNTAHRLHMQEACMTATAAGPKEGLKNK